MTSTIAKDPDFMYYDMSYWSFQNTTAESQHLDFNETRNQPIINNPNDFDLSVVRFQVDTQSLPTYICDIEPNQGDKDLTIYSISLSYWDGTSETTPNPVVLRWVPAHTEVSVPVAPNATSNGFQVDSMYYWGYSFQRFGAMINTAFTTAFTGLQSLVGGALASAAAPAIIYNEDLKRFSIIGEELYYNINRTAHIRIFFNRPLFSLLSSFPFKRFSITSKNVYQILMDDEKGVNLIQKSLVAGNKVSIELHQEYSTLSNFNPISALVFTTSLLPIVPSQQSAPLVFNNNSLISDANQNSVQCMIITDISNNDEYSYKPNLIYNPSAEYRRIALNSNRPIYSVDVKVFVKWRDGSLKPFYIWSGTKASIKLLFEKKSHLRLLK